MNEANIIKAYELAKESYASLGIDTDAVLEKLKTDNTSYLFFKNLETAVAYQATLKEATGTIEQIFTQEYEIKEN